MKNLLIILVFEFMVVVSFSQSKKEQIEILTNRVDSLNRVVGEERSSNQNKINELNSVVTKLESQIAALSSNLATLTKELQESKNDILKKQKDIVENQKEISKLQSALKIKSDSLEIVKKEQSSHSYQVTQTGSYKSVKIGNQTWMAENLNVSTFRNGDPIPQAKTNEEWEKAGEDGKPAWCYYENDPKNGAKYGKLYNWYAVNDSRGLAPTGWHIPTDAEWTILSDYLGDEGAAGKKMKSTSGWENYGCKKCAGGSSEYQKICSACKGTQSNSSDPFIGNGTNSSGFSGLPGGNRSNYGTFYDIGDNGHWWSSSEYDTANAWNRYLDYYDGLVNRNYGFKVIGFSVRCLRD